VRPMTVQIYGGAAVVEMLHVADDAGVGVSKAEMLIPPRRMIQLNFIMEAKLEFTDSAGTND
jgi:hypothetical protein